MLTDEQRLRVYGNAERVASVDRYLDELAAAAPPLTQAQKDRLRALIRSDAEPRATAA